LCLRATRSSCQRPLPEASAIRTRGVVDCNPSSARVCHQSEYDSQEKLVDNPEAVRQAIRDLQRERITVNGHLLPPVTSRKELIHLLQQTSFTFVDFAATNIIHIRWFTFGKTGKTKLGALR
jgi:hypothetical protein